MQKILIILVIYNENLYDSKTYNSLIQSISKFKKFKSLLHLIIYDNSLTEQNHIENDLITTQYIHNPSNGGLAVAYNFAFAYALEFNYSWILLLDQDTILQELFLYNLIIDLNKLHNANDYVAIVPTAHTNNKTLSPYIIKFGNRYSTIDSTNNNINKDLNIYAVNSGSLIRTNFLKEIGGFDEIFWLDFLDHWLFHQIYLKSKKVYINKNIIEHNLSISSYKDFSLTRFKNILYAESIFIKRYSNLFNKLIYKIILILRSLKFLFYHHRYDFSLIIIKNIFK
jgi:GT2 family glycosyltransferase